jgi:hypothetical protein
MLALIVLHFTSRHAALRRDMGGQFVENKWVLAYETGTLRVWIDERRIEPYN